MAKLGEPALYRPGVTYIACLQCRMAVCIQRDGSSIGLSYDIAAWERCKCCCGHLDGPVYCCSFTDLKKVLVELALTH
jgi:hypothetical protein